MARWQVGYIKELAEKKGPFPRHQDLKSGPQAEGYFEGLPPGRKFSLSHGWSSEMHPCPSGAKLKRLAVTLEKHGADDEEDGVFLDYFSLPQVLATTFHIHCPPMPTQPAHMRNASS